MWVFLCPCLLKLWSMSSHHIKYTTLVYVGFFRCPCLLKLWPMSSYLSVITERLCFSLVAYQCTVSSCTSDSSRPPLDFLAIAGNNFQIHQYLLKALVCLSILFYYCLMIPLKGLETERLLVRCLAALHAWPSSRAVVSAMMSSWWIGKLLILIVWSPSGFISPFYSHWPLIAIYLQFQKYCIWGGLNRTHMQYFCAVP